MIAGRFRSVERTFALSPVEAGEVAARKRCPHDSLLVDVGAADAEARQWDVVDFGERRLRGIRSRDDANDCPRKLAVGAPDRAVGRARHHGVETGHDPLVLGRIHGLVRLDVSVALAIAVGVEDHRRPALRFRRVAGLVEYLHVEPADDLPAAAGPQSVVGIELQMMRPKAGVDERVLLVLGSSIESWRLCARWEKL